MPAALNCFCGNLEQRCDFVVRPTVIENEADNLSFFGRQLIDSLVKADPFFQLGKVRATGWVPTLSRLTVLQMDRIVIGADPLLPIQTAR